MIAIVVAAGLTLLTAACGDDDQVGSSAPTRVARIAVIAPLDDGLVQFGQGIRNSVQLAVDEPTGPPYSRTGGDSRYWLLTTPPTRSSARLRPPRRQPTQP